MISLNIKDANNFMNRLLADTLFDKFLLFDCEIDTLVTFKLNGSLHRDFFDNPENECPEDFVSWGNIKRICYTAIKGKKPPLKAKFIFAMPKSFYPKFIENKKLAVSFDNISGLFLNISYENGSIRVVTGTSLKVFTLDKNLDHAWDEFALEFLKSHFDVKEAGL